jgi:hypothetical protein
MAVPALPVGYCDLPGMGATTPCQVGGALRAGLGEVAGGAAAAAVREMASAVVGAAKEVAGAVAGFLSAPADPDLGQSWFTASFGQVMAASGGFAVLLFLLGIGSAVLHSSTGELGRVAAYTVLAFAGSAVAITLVQAFVLFTDAATEQLSAGTRTDITSLFARLMSPLTAMTNGVAAQAVLAVLLAVLIGLGMLAVYLELFVRSVMIHVLVLFVPLMLMGTIWAPTRRWAKRGTEFLAVLVLSKFVLFAVIALGWSAITAVPGPHQPATDSGSTAARSTGTITGLHTAWASVLTGVVLVVVAAWLPWLLFKLLPFMETHARTALTRGDARAGLAAPAHAAATPVRVLGANLGRAAQLAGAVKTGGASQLAAAGAGGGAGRGGAGRRGGGAGGGLGVLGAPRRQGITGSGPGGIPGGSSGSGAGGRRRGAPSAAGGGPGAERAVALGWGPAAFPPAPAEGSTGHAGHGPQEARGGCPGARAGTYAPAPPPPPPHPYTPPPPPSPPQRPTPSDRRTGGGRP